MPTGTAILDFGAFPGAAMAQVDVTGQTAISAGSFVEVWIAPATTGAGATDHTHDEHIVDPPRVTFGNIVAGTGFTIYGFGYGQTLAVDPIDPYDKNQGRTSMHFGKWNVAWVWQ